MPISDVVDGDMSTCTTRLLEARRQPPMGPTMEYLAFPDIKVGESYMTADRPLMLRLLQRISTSCYLQLVERFHDCRSLHQELQRNRSTSICSQLRYRRSLLLSYRALTNASVLMWSKLERRRTAIISLLWSTLCRKQCPAMWRMARSN
jgi:hypothetical protein